jgi:hypothetical protein
MRHRGLFNFLDARLMIGRSLGGAERAFFATTEVQVSAAELVIRKQPFITAYVQRFRETKNLEVIYGGFCTLFHRPSRVYTCDKEAPLISILKEKSVLAHYGTRSRARLLQLYGGVFKVGLLPADFQGARGESIRHDGDRLIIGEYGENSRIAYVTPQACIMSDPIGSSPV